MKRLINSISLLFIMSIIISSCSNEEDILSPTDLAVTKSVESCRLESDYTVLGNYLIIENYRYKLSISDEKVLSLGVEKKSLDQFKNEIAVVNDVIAKNETDPETIIRKNLPNKEAVVVPTLLKSGKRKSMPVNAEQRPMLIPFSEDTTIIDSTSARIGQYLGGMDVGQNCFFEGKDLIESWYYVQSAHLWSFSCRCDIFVVPNEGWRTWLESGFGSSNGSKDWQFSLVPESGKCWWEFSSINTGADGSSINFKFYNKN